MADARDDGEAAIKEVMSKLDEALRLLDMLDTTPFGSVEKNLDRITNAVSSAKYILELKERAARSVQEGQT